MGYKCVILPQAQRDYQEIVSYLVDVLRSPQAAKNFMDEFDRQIDLLCSSPDIFALSRLPELAAKGYRSLFVNNYIALVALDGDIVRVAHIFHQTQDYAHLV